MPSKPRRKFSEYTGKTSNGKLTVDCWSDKNTDNPEDISWGSAKKDGLNAIIVHMNSLNLQII